ncbi:DUF305 domain-containing protein [Dictyobacter arantiisoli]|uniref:DUF305 domain-containing protein n=1 Tax=Dictyobacter arantiisoli TaxID=2014874 RepID=A0A5A5TFS4_9CHLR|nr:DUF305 domain-containing protein [Dictyobacter arantiisoli]GCF10065.1 hypothetical protein KDI_36290 [Dictyobacter arantiisoli]
MMNYRCWSLLGSLLLIFVLAGCGGTDTTTTPTTTTNTTNHARIAGVPGGTTNRPTSHPTKSAIIMTTDPMTSSLSSLTGKDFEVQFMQEMIVHHQVAIDMASMVPAHTKRVELSTLSQRIITSQTQDIKNMTGWLNQWYHVKPLANTAQVPGMTAMTASMYKLRMAKNAIFDKQFNSLMIQHHQQGINMARLIPGKTQRPELLKLSQAIIQAQSAEIQQMKGWQKAWFNA